ncbi:hypothetical protein [Pseudomonas sp. LAIL14HWK12:I4]|uniref:hypothetical protein n=1 Tax=Pseudomonas sp. LAIL14HWK12:I4 TaxID=1259802 RepID=UPI00195ED5C2|nr:hypothetical protein [Pseudomonas sp. LAIL14HWK12:I4]
MHRRVPDTATRVIRDHVLHCYGRSGACRAMLVNGHLYWLPEFQARSNLALSYVPFTVSWVGMAGEGVSQENS